MANISHFTQTVNGISTTYDIHDADAIPLAGTNALAGSIVPSTNLAYNLGSPNYFFSGIYSYGIHTAFIYNYDNTSQVAIYGGTSYQNGAEVTAYGKDHPYNSGCVYLIARDGTNTKAFIAKPNGTLTWGSKNVAMQEDVVPRSGGAVMTGSSLGPTYNDSSLRIDGGSGYNNGASIGLSGKDRLNNNGVLVLHPADGLNYKNMELHPSGTWTWTGSAVQLISDQRLKQQIAEIDDKLLDAWEDVDLVQFKYNDAVDQKKDKARLHTGYVVQQIDSACKSHGVDVSQYGLYCHEEYPQETEEVEVEQADGTKTKEKKVIREASEHYSLRYTEALIVECAYLRKCIKELRNEIEELKSSK